MSNNRITFHGLEELRQALQDLPEHLAREAFGIVEESTASAEAEAAQAYAAHRRSGKLGSKLKRKVTKDGASVVGTVRNSSPIAHIFENGSQARHTDIGANRGSMPPAHVFIPAMIRWRKRMYERLKDMMVREGLLVSGDA